LPLFLGFFDEIYFRCRDWWKVEFAAGMIEGGEVAVAFSLESFAPRFEA
jgi:hypothetical protein